MKTVRVLIASLSPGPGGVHGAVFALAGRNPWPLWGEHAVVVRPISGCLCNGCFEAHQAPSATFPPVRELYPRMQSGATSRIFTSKCIVYGRCPLRPYPGESQCHGDLGGSRAFLVFSPWVHNPHWRALFVTGFGLVKSHLGALIH